MSPVVTRLSTSPPLRRVLRPPRRWPHALAAVLVAGALGAAGPVATPASAQAQVRAGRPAAAPGAGATAFPAAPAAPAAPSAPDDPVRDEQWQLDYLDADDAWQHARGTGITVAVLDSGVDGSHPDLAGQVLPGLDLVDSSTDGRSDPVGHGTTVAALIAGRGDDSRGVIGLAPNAKILPVRVLNKDNRYDDATTVADGLRWAVDHGAQVVNLSLGGTGSSQALAEALDYAFAKDVVVVACTGNITPPAPTQVWYPAREPGVLAVAGLAHGAGDAPLWTSSITGRQTVLAAPAADLLGARPGGYWRVQGTSFAAPLVSATAALVRSMFPRMSAANVVNRLIATARDLGSAGRDDEYGFGAVDPVGALTGRVPPVQRNPLDNNQPHGVTGFGAAPAGDDAGSDLFQAGPPSGSAPAESADPGEPDLGEPDPGETDPGEANSGGGAKRTTAAPATEHPNPWRGPLGGLAACVVLIGIAATAANRLNRR
jgi:type VII secretion-associated serine protease mycosin